MIIANRKLILLKGNLDAFNSRKVVSLYYSVIVYGFLLGSFDKTIDYQDAKQMPGYGYIVMDFRLANEMAYGNGYIQEKQTIQFLIKIKVIFFLLIFSMLIFVIEY